MDGLQASPQGISSTARRVRKVRASVACDVCRARKVRCSVASDGPPCTNCRLDGIECTIPTSGRAWARSIHAAPVAGGNRRRRHSSIGGGSSTLAPAISPSAFPLIAPRVDVELLPMAAQCDSPHLSPHELQNPHPGPTAMYEHLGPVAPQTSGRPGWTTYDPMSLPSFIHPITDSLSPDLLRYLSLSEAFSFPASHVAQSAIVNAFIRDLYYLYPLFELDELRQLAVQDPQSESPVCFSLLTFQALLFAAIPFVDLATCQSLGFESHVVARHALYRRAKLIYDSDVEEDVAALAQFLILVSFWNESERVPRDAWYWTGCLSCLIERYEPWRDMGTAAAPITAKLWWCCLVRDAHVALVMRKPPRLRKLHHLVPFETIRDCLSSTGYQAAGDLDQMRMDPVTCLTLSVRLSTMIGVILQNDPASTELESPEYRNRIFQSCERDLAAWSTAFSEAFPGASEKRHRLDPSTGPFIAVSLMCHDTAVNALYLPRVLEARESRTKSDARIRIYLERMRRAATRTSVLINEALSSEWAENIPTHFFTALLSAIPVHIITSESTTSLRSLGTCVGFLRRVKSRYGLAEHLERDILSTLARMNVTIYRDRNVFESSSSDSASSSSSRSPEEFLANTPPTLGSNERVFKDLGDPFDDDAWDISRWEEDIEVEGTGEVDQDSIIVAQDDDFMQDLLSQQMFDKNTPMGACDAWSGAGGLAGDITLYNMPQELQSWFDDAYIVTAI